MTHSVHRAIELPYTIEQLYLIISDITQYPDFIPWCAELKITEQLCQEHFFAEVTITALGFSEMYISEVRLQAPDEHAAKVTATANSGPFVSMESAWILKKLEDNRSKIEFSTNFQLKSSVLSLLIKQMLPLACYKIVQSFVSRAHSKFGAQSSKSHPITNP